MSASRVTSGLPSAVGGRQTPYLSREQTLSGYDSNAPSRAADEVSELEQLCQQNVVGYNVICAELGIVPSSYIERQLWSGGTQIAMTSHGLGAKGARALSVILVNNTYITRLDIADNNIGNSGARAVAQMLSSNITIKHVDLSGNNITDDGLRHICTGSVNKRELKSLNLSGNTITPVGIQSLQDFLENNIYVAELFLSHCNIDTDTASLLGQSLGSNDTLLTLDLSWNKIRGRGAVAIAKGLKDNRGLLRVDLSWNGFGFDGCRALEDALKKNKTLVDLDLTSNRVHAEGAACVMRGLQRNASLEVLKFSKNPLTSEACTVLLTAIDKMKSTAFRELHIKDIEVNDSFMDELAEVRSRRDIIIHSGPLLSRRGKRDAPPTGQPKLDTTELLRSIVEGEGVKAVDTIIQKELKQRSEEIHRQMLEAKKTAEERKLAELSGRFSSGRSSPVTPPEYVEPDVASVKSEDFRTRQDDADALTRERDVTSALREGPDPDEVIASYEGP